MNKDLRIRLEHHPTSRQCEFFENLQWELWNICSNKGRRSLVVDIKEINSEDDDTAYIEGDDETLHIIIDSRVDFGTQCDYLIHEMAHADCWDLTLSWKEDHCSVWGESYAKMYRRYLEIYKETMS
jgi:hypothetical protein